MEAKRAQMLARLEQRKKAAQKPKILTPQEIFNSTFEVITHFLKSHFKHLKKIIFF